MDCQCVHFRMRFNGSADSTNLFHSYILICIKM